MVAYVYVCINVTYNINYYKIIYNMMLLCFCLLPCPFSNLLLFLLLPLSMKVGQHGQDPMMGALTDERPLYAETVAPEVRAAVGHGAVTEEVAVTDGVQVGDCAEVVSAGAAASSPLAVGAKRVPDAAYVQRAGQLPLGPPVRGSLCSTLTDHQEQHHHS